jgi:hypothetical protein
VLPFHCSANASPMAGPMVVPAAVQALVDTHDTPPRLLPVYPGLGLGCIAQAAPPHASTSVASLCLQ